MPKLSWTDELDPTTIEQPAIDAFTLGWCWALAEALNKETGWSIVIKGYSEAPFMFCGKPMDMDFIKVTGWEHAYVQRPDGKVVDIHGVSDAPEDLRTLEDLGWTIDNLIDTCDDAGDTETPRRFAAAYARTMLDTIKEIQPA